jgi:predicted nucleic acid-binding protein
VRAAGVGERGLNVEKYVLDTNIYIDAMRSAAARADLAAFQRVRAPQLYQHAVVVAEILAGAPDEATFRRWRARWVEPSERVRRVIAPGYEAWAGAVRVIVRLFERGHIGSRSVPRGFMNDCLIAIGAREHGCTVVTHNVRDYGLIARAVPGLQYVPPFP